MGPILPILQFSSISEVISFINARHKPLALYYFGNVPNKQRLLRETSSGCFGNNETVLQAGNIDLPFGGVGFSGYSYRGGYWGFKAHTHFKPVFDKWAYNGSVLRNRYPPYTEHKTRLLRRSFGLFAATRQASVVKVCLCCFLVVVALIVYHSCRHLISKRLFY